MTNKERSIKYKRLVQEARFEIEYLCYLRGLILERTERERDDVLSFTRKTCEVIIKNEIY